MEILNFRDQAFYEYHSSPEFLSKIESKFGEIAKNTMLEIISRTLVREEL
jgi:hypothetical protein